LAPATRSDEFERVRETVNALRTIRSEYAVAPGKFIDAFIAPTNDATIYNEEAALIGRLSRSTLTLGAPADANSAAHALLSDGADVAVPLGGLVDVAKECAKLRTEVEHLDKQLTALSGRLANPGFTSRAPANVVDAERAKEQEWTQRRDQMRAKIEALCGA
jgi:valyl-tRNA synthetase